MKTHSALSILNSIKLKANGAYNICIACPATNVKKVIREISETVAGARVFTLNSSSDENIQFLESNVDFNESNKSFWVPAT